VLRISNLPCPIWKEQNRYMKNIVVELPHYDKSSGGINRVIRIVLELPFYCKTSGGVNDTIKMAKGTEPFMMVRFQHLNNGYPDIQDLIWSVGLPDHTFPECDICITYADNPHTQRLLQLPQVKKVYILMLSYGMNLPVESRNVHMPGISVLCSSKKIEKAIKSEGVKVNRIGVALDMSDMYVMPDIRKKYLAILYHDMETKRYKMAVEIADYLYAKKIIDGVITFGGFKGYDSAVKPKGLKKHYTNATKDEVREVFNSCRCFLMPSSTEGINLTPIESTVCGCPAVLFDGAIDEVFFDKRNCFISKSKSDMISMCTEVINNFDNYSEPFRLDMLETIKDMTWESVLRNLIKALWK